MKFISSKEKSTSYGCLHIGATFLYDGTVYIKSYDNRYQNYGAVALTGNDCGLFYQFANQDKVSLIKCVLQEVNEEED